MTVLVPYVVEKTQNGERAMDIYSRLLQERIIYIGSDFNDQMSSSVVSQLLYLYHADKKKDISIYINSPGGAVTSGLAIYDTIQALSVDVSTVCLGQCASMGAFLLSSGTKGKRLALPNSRIMIHQPSGGYSGQATDVEIHYKEMMRIKQTLTSILAVNCGKEYDEMFQACERDNYMSAAEAMEFGLIDKVITEI